MTKIVLTADQEARVAKARKAGRFNVTPRKGVKRRSWWARNTPVAPTPTPDEAA